MCFSLLKYIRGRGGVLYFISMGYGGLQLYAIRNSDGSFLNHFYLLEGIPNYQNKFSLMDVLSPFISKSYTCP